MPFPEAPRVIYNKNPLDKVICQVQFPPILKIEVDIPAAFQDRIRNIFPRYSETPKIQIDVPQEIMKNIPGEIISQFPLPLQKKNHEFSSDDDIWKVNLTSTFFALSCTEYTRWEEFRDKMKIAFETFLDVYSPPYCARIGLRYVDLIRRSDIGLEDVKWSKLLKPHTLGLLSSPDVEDRIDAFENKYELRLNDNTSKVRILTGFVEHMIEHENCFIIDSDFFNNDRMSIEQVWDKLEYLHERSSRLIRWCITDKLHASMEPSRV